MLILQSKNQETFLSHWKKPLSYELDINEIWNFKTGRLAMVMVEFDLDKVGEVPKVWITLIWIE